MIFYTKTKIGNKEEFKENLESYGGSEVIPNLYQVSLDTLEDLYRFMKDSANAIGEKMITPVLCPLEDNEFELRFEE